MSKSVKSKTVNDPRELSSVSAPSKIIHHVNVMPEGFDCDQFTKAIDGFVDAAKYVVRKYEENESIIARADLETQDLLHETHLLPNANVVEGYRYYRRLREVQLARRRAKHENTLMKPLYLFVQQRPGSVGELTHLRNQLKDAQNKVENYKYTYRIQD